MLCTLIGAIILSINIQIGLNMHLYHDIGMHRCPFEGRHLVLKLINYFDALNEHKDDKIYHGRGNYLRNRVTGWVELSSPDPLTPLPTGWENTERIASMNSYCQVLTEPVIFPGLKCHFNKTAVYWPSWWLQWTHHTIPSFRLQLAQTDVPLQEQRIYAHVLLSVVCSCASFHGWPIQVHPSKNNNTRVIPDQTTTNKR